MNRDAAGTTALDPEPPLHLDERVPAGAKVSKENYEAIYRLARVQAAQHAWDAAESYAQELDEDLAETIAAAFYRLNEAAYAGVRGRVEL